MIYTLLLVAASALFLVTGQPPPSCQQSGSNCVYCNGTACTSCYPYYGLNFTTTPVTCSPCGSNCIICSANSRATCSTCKAGYGPVLNATTSECGECSTIHCSSGYCPQNGAGSCDICDQGYIMNPATGLCSGCPGNCTDCSISGPTGCNACIAGFFVALNGTNPPNQCVPCPTACYAGQCYASGTLP